MSDLGYTPKFILMANKIREEIVSGKIGKGEWLKSDSELAAQFKINKRTVANGMAELVREGLICRQPKRGTLVISNTPLTDDKPRSNAVGILADSYGHSYSEMSAVMNEMLIERGLYPVWIEHKMFNDAVMTNNPEKVILLLKHLLKDNPYGFIINADRYLPVDFILENIHAMGNVVYMLNNNITRELPGAYVVTDYYQVGHMMAEHFAGHGHTRMGYLSAEVYSFKTETERNYLTGHERVSMGMAEFCRQNGLEFVEESATRSFAGEPILKIMADLQERRIMPTAVGAHSDSIAKNRIYPAAAKLGLSIPGDLSVIGTNNTPWAEKTQPHLTSVSLNHLDIARLAVERLFDGKQGKYVVEPSLVERDSVCTV